MFLLRNPWKGSEALVLAGHGIAVLRVGRSSSGSPATAAPFADGHPSGRLPPLLYSLRCDAHQTTDALTSVKPCPRGHRLLITGVQVATTSRVPTPWSQLKNLQHLQPRSRQHRRLAMRHLPPTASRVPRRGEGSGPMALAEAWHFHRPAREARQAPWRLGPATSTRSPIFKPFGPLVPGVSVPFLSSRIVPAWERQAPMLGLISGLVTSPVHWFSHDRENRRATQQTHVPYVTSLYH